MPSPETTAALVQPAQPAGTPRRDAPRPSAAGADRSRPSATTVDREDDDIAREIAGALLDEHERIATQMVAAIDGEVTAYAASGEARRILADVRAHCDAHITSFLSSLQAGATSIEPDLGFVEEAIVRRVRQGIPLEAILQSFRVGHQVLWTAVIDCASRVPGGRAAAILIVGPSMQYIDTVSTRVAEVYMREQQRALADADRISRDVLELLLAGGPRAAAAAEAAGLELAAAGPHHLLAATIRPSEDRYALQMLAEEIASAFAGWAVLVVIRHHTVTALLRGDGTGALDCARRVVGRYGGAPSPSPLIGISLPAEDLGGLGRAHEQAESALRLASQATPIIALGRMPALDYLVAGADHVARSLVPCAVRALALSTKRTDMALVNTLDVYLASGLNVKQTAAALPAHPNTVHDRLRRLAERTGYDLRDVEQLMRLAVELRLGAVA